jgi:F0F1-type ATP synthase alpha subunit
MLVVPLRWSARKYHAHVLIQMGGGQKIVLIAERKTANTACAVGGYLNKSNLKWLSL